MKTNIFIVVDNLGAGGTQQQIIEYLKHANRDKFDIRVVNLDRSTNVLKKEIENLGYQVIEIAHKGFINLSTLFKLKRLFKKEKPDIVNTFLFTADCYARLAAKLSGVPVIISSVRNIDLWQKWHHNLVDKVLAGISDSITINAEIIREHLVKNKGINSNKITTIYNGINLRRFDNLRSVEEVKREFGIPVDALVVGMVACFAERKDYGTFFKAAGEIAGKMRDVYFLAVGDGALLQDYKDSISKNTNLNNKVIFTGLRRDIPDLINAMDICVLSSHYEGCPNVVLEYMACAKPVIASDVGGCPELVVNNKTGFIVPKEDPAALSEKILLLLNDGSLRIEMGRAGRIRAENEFTCELMVKKTEDLYERSVKSNVIFIFSQFPCYDETFILREMNALKNEGLKFLIFSLKTPKDKIVHDEAKGLSTDTIYLPFFSLKIIFAQLYFLIFHPIKYISALFYIIRIHLPSFDFLVKSIILFPKSVYLAKIIHKNKIRHIHAQWATHPTTSAIIISRLTGLPYSFTGHAHDIHVDTAGLKEKILHAKFITTCTADNKRYLLNILNSANKETENKVIVNYHGLDLERFKNNNISPSINSKLRILSVGSLLECKGFDILIKACRILKDKGISFECTIAGGGPLKDNLRILADNLQLDGRIKFTGYITQDKLIPLYKEADVFALPAKLGIHWGIPNVIIEAMAAKIPVICTQLASIPEAIIDKQTGFIMPDQNPDTLAEILSRINQDNTLRKKVGLAAHEVIKEKFDINKNANNLMRVFLNSRGEK